MQVKLRLNADEVRVWEGELLCPVACPFHDDEHPSAFVILQKDGRVRFKCHACLARAGGRWRKEGEEIEVVLKKRGRGEAPPQLSPSSKLSDRSIAYLMGILRFQAHMILSGRKVRPSVTTSRFLQRKLKGLDANSLPEKPIVGLGVFFPLFSPDFARVKGFHVRLPTKPKALMVLLEEAPWLGYIPDPKRVVEVRKCIVVESPFNAARLAVLGFPSTASLGKARIPHVVGKLTKEGIKCVAFVDEFPPPTHLAFVLDLDTLTNEQLLEVGRKWMG